MIACKRSNVRRRGRLPSRGSNMYESHFGLREMPFSITPDTSFAFAGRQHQNALNTLLVAVRNLEGFIKITGEVGAGKTLLCRRFLALRDADCATAYIPNPFLEPGTLLLAIAGELGIERPAGADQHQVHKYLTEGLLKLAREGKHMVLCVDEAQAMPRDTLEMLRLLTNLETEKRKLIQVVLFGQPELDEKLADPRVRQLRQRITFQFHLGNLEAGEVGSYLEHRLRVAGHGSSEVFSAAAVRALHRGSGGLPRLINILAHKSMMLAYGEGAYRVERRHVAAAQADTPAAPRPAALGRWAGVALTCVSAAGAAWAWFA